MEQQKKIPESFNKILECELERLRRQMPRNQRQTFLLVPRLGASMFDVNVKHMVKQIILQLNNP